MKTAKEAYKPRQASLWPLLAQMRSAAARRKRLLVGLSGSDPPHDRNDANDPYRASAVRQWSCDR